MLKNNITIISQQNNLFEISAKSADRSLSDRENAIVSQQIVRKLLDVLAQENFSSGKAVTSQTLKVLDGQIQARAKDLQVAEKRRVDFEQRNIGLLPGTGSIGTRIDQARNEMSQVDTQIVAVQSELAGINGQLGTTPATIDSVGGGTGQGVSPLGQAMGELAQARARGWTDNHPDVVALKRQIASLRSMSSGGSNASATTRTPNPAYVQLRSLQAEKTAGISALQSRRASLSAQMGGMTAKQVEEPGIAAEQARLSRDYDTIKTQYDKLSADREEARLRGDVQSEAGTFRVRLIDPPGVPSAPASPNRPLLLIGVLLAAIGAGVGLAFVLGQLRSTYATAGRLERSTGIPVMGAITETLGAAAIAKRRRGLGIFAGASAGLFVMCLMLVVLEFVQRGMAA
jgi:polysaccharide chain length determinant protein (PEP-CTERM system associated)